MQTKPLGSFGVEISDLDLRQPLDAAATKALVDLVAENHVAVFRGQSLSKADYDRFGKLWGDPISFFFTPDLDPEFPALIRISNSPELDAGRRDGASFWHTDGSYEHLPASFTMLYGIEAPEVGGETLYADMTAAYEALPAETRARIDPLYARHMLVGGKRGPDETPLKIDPDAPDRDGGVRARKRAARSRAPRRGSFSFEIEGLGKAEGEILLAELKAHALQDQFVIRVKANAGDVLIWDNFATLHRATPIEYSAEDGKRRALLRISTNGLPAIYADRKPTFQARPDVEVVRFA